MTDKPCGECRECGNLVALRLDGRTYVHGKRDQADRCCPGSGLKPRPAEERQPPVMLKVLLPPDLVGEVRRACRRLGMAPHDLTRSALREYCVRH